MNTTQEQQKITFTQEHRTQLQSLCANFLFSGRTISGKIGTEINIYDLLHNTTLRTTQELYSNVTKTIESKEKLDRWSMTEYQQNELKKLKTTQELLDLMIGYKKAKSQAQADKEKLAQLRATMKELEESTKTPEARLAELKAEIDSIGNIEEID